MPTTELVRDADRLLWRAVRQGRGWTVTMLATSLVSAAATVIFPAVFAAAVDERISGGAPGGALFWFAATLTVVVSCELLGQLATPSSTSATTRWLRRHLLRHVLTLGVSTRDPLPPGDVVSRLVSGTAEAGGAGPTLVNGVVSTVVSVGGIVGLGLIDPWLAVTLLIGLPIGIVVIKVFVADTSHLAAEYFGAYSAVAGRLVEAFAGIRTIRASGTMRREVARVLAPAADLTRLGQATWHAYTRVSWQASLLVPGIQLAVLSVAGFGVAAGRLTPGQFLGAIGYASLGLGFLGQAGALLSLARARGGARRVAEILDLPPLPRGADSLADGPGELVLTDVTVTVGDRRVLDHVDLTVPAGRSVAVVGRSGSGKSTVAAVAGLLIAPDDGQVLLDGTPLDTIHPTTLRREITYAFAQPALLGETVADAIALGPDRLSAQRVESAARMACVDQVVHRLPLGFGTALSGAPMSGGETQRLGLARAIARCGRLLILDDAGSGLDCVTEAQIASVLTDAFAGRTRIVVTHRPATVARCDLVAWLEGGRVRALAPHHVLWRDADYRDMFQPAGSADVREPAWTTNPAGR
jgi:ATP-binding cassette subfamily B protein